MKSILLLIFVKNPVAGEVKTRLAATIGNLNALQIYKTLLAHTRSVALNVNCDRQVWYSSKVDRRDAWEADKFDKKLQQGSDLGERMAYAFQQGFENKYEKIVIIGSDCAELSHNHIKSAFETLDDYDAVLGPSKDGGYYLLGLTGYRAEVFNDVEWSTPEVYAQTVDTFRQSNISYQVLETLNDIDTIDDLRESSLKIEALDE